MSITLLDTNNSNVINLAALRSTPSRKIAPGLIAPAIEDTASDTLVEHSAEPIKSLDDIFRVSQYLITNNRYRDNMMFIVGINFGLRASDLRMLRFNDLINENCTFKDSFPVFEIKTRNTRKRKKNRYITINHAVMEAVTLFLEHTPNVSLSDYMFKSADHKLNGQNTPITVRAMNLILKGIADDLSLNMRVSTHTLRKTFCYHQMVMSHNDSRKLLLLQKMLNHSSPAQTLDYIGITCEEIEEAYRRLNLGSKQHNYLIDSDIQEYDAVAG